MKSEKGFSLLEVAIAIALISIIAVTFLIAMAGAPKAISIADERATAESLARSQMEYVKSQDYIYAIEYIVPPPDEVERGQATYEKIADEQIPEGYVIMSYDHNNNIVDDIKGVPWDPDPEVNQPVDEDVGLQRIELVIEHLGKSILTLEGYKVNR
jgi:prepilin-type N-terminal cleavage/methylation domain-containing protein